MRTHALKIVVNIACRCTIVLWAPGTLACRAVSCVEQQSERASIWAQNYNIPHACVNPMQHTSTKYEQKCTIEQSIPQRGEIRGCSEDVAPIEQQQTATNAPKQITPNLVPTPVQPPSPRVPDVPPGHGPPPPLAAHQHRKQHQVLNVYCCKHRTRLQHPRQITPLDASNICKRCSVRRCLR